MWTKQNWVILLILFGNDDLIRKKNLLKPEKFILYNSYSIQIINLSFVFKKGERENASNIFGNYLCSFIRYE